MHFISYEPPFRLDRKQPNVFFHQVELNEYRLFKYPDYTLPLAVKMVEVADKHKLDILHVHYAVPHATAALLATQIARDQNAARAPRDYHAAWDRHHAAGAGSEPGADHQVFDREFLRGHGGVAQSAKETIQVLKSKKPIEVIYNFYRPKPPRKGRQEVRRALRVRQDDFLLIHMSNLRPVKRAQDVLRVLAELKSQRNIKLLILAGESFEPFRKMVKRLGIHERVIVKSNVLDIENYLHAADAGLYTSERESFGMGVLETMSFGKPVVATRVGGVTEIMRDGETGFLKRLGDVKAMAAAIRTLANDPELAARMGEAARIRAEQEFSSQKSVEQYLDLYRRTIRDCPD